MADQVKKVWQVRSDLRFALSAPDRINLMPGDVIDHTLIADSLLKEWIGYGLSLIHI